MCDLFGTLGGAVNMVGTPDDDDESDDDDAPSLVDGSSDGESTDDDEKRGDATTDGGDTTPHGGDPCFTAFRSRVSKPHSSGTSFPYGPTTTVAGDHSARV